MPRLRFFVPTNRRDRRGNEAPLDGLNELVGSNRSGWRYGSARKRENGQNAEAACLAAMVEQGWSTPDVRCVVTMTFVEPHRRRDPDNVYGGAKFILDGITERRGSRQYGAGAIHDDSQRWMRLVLDPDIRVDRERVGCWVTIETEEDVGDEGPSQDG